MALMSRRGSGLGGLLGGAPNPLMYAGLGLLSQGPSLTPQAPLGGLAQGLALYGQARNAYEDRQLRQQQFEAQERERQAKAEQQAAEARRAGAMQSAQEQALILRGMDPQQAALIAASGAAGDFLKPTKPVDQWSEPRTMRVGDRDVLVQENAATGQLRSVGGGGVQVDARQMPQPILRGTPGGGTMALVPDGKGGFTMQEVIPGREPGAAAEAAAEVKQEGEAEAAAEAKARLATLLDEYEGMASATGLWGAKQKRADVLRREIAKARARALEPTGKLTDSDIELQMMDIPEIGGPLDAAQAGPIIDQIRSNAGIPTRQGTAPAAASAPQTSDGRSIDDLVNQYAD